MGPILDWNWLLDSQNKQKEGNSNISWPPTQIKIWDSARKGCHRWYIRVWKVLCIRPEKIDKKAGDVDIIVIKLSTGMKLVRWPTYASSNKIYRLRSKHDAHS